MPKTYTRKTERASYSKETLSEALKAIKDGRKIREVGRSFGIPESTLRKQMLSNQPKFPRIGRKAVFSPEIEQDLAEYILKLCKLFYGITQKQLRRLAFKYAEEHNIPHSFNREKGLAGKDWLYGFLKRHSNISLRQPQATSLNRIAGFNKEEVQLFYKNLETVMKTHKFPAHRIYNQDETGVSTVQKRCQKVYGPKGVKQIGAATSAERGRTITAIFAMSASGHFLPPMLIYPRTRMTPLLERNGPPGALYACSPNGWSNNDIFIKWLFHFKDHVHPTEDSPVLLIMDNHNSHVSIDVYKFCKSNFIHIVSLPPHTSHRLQPLDLTFFSPLKNAFYRACDFYLTSTGHTKITEHDVAGLLNKAFEQVAKISNAVSGFKTAGIYPFDADKFGEDDFAAAQHDANDQNIAVEMVDVSAAAASPNQSPKNTNNANETDDAPSGNGVVKTSNQSNLADLYVNPIPSTSKDSSFLSFAPIPKKVVKPGKTKGRAKQHSEIITSTPMKVKLEVAEEKRKANEIKKKEREMKKAARCLGFDNKKDKIKKPAKPKRKIKHEHDSSEESDIDDPKMLCQDDEFDDFDNNLLPSSVEKHSSDVCNICGDIGKNRELWYRCVNCSSWSHADCSGADTAENYVCYFCLNP